jgi:hypothetical protein
MITFALIRQWVRELIFGRSIPAKNRYMTVDINKVPIIRPVERAKPAIKYLNGDHIIVLPFDDPLDLSSFIEQHKDMVYRYMLKRFEHALHRKKTSVILFQFGNTKKIARVKSTGYNLQLTKMLEFFVGIEDYESATLCRDLIRGLM